jgi:hypothetical protein
MPPSRALLVSAVCVAGAANAQTFAEQVVKAKVEAAKPEGQKYERSLYPAIGQAMRTCVPPGTTSHETLGNFTLVGAVTTSGTLRGALIEPESKVAMCFRKEFMAARLPPPPYVLPSPGGAGFPVVVEMKLVP